MKSVRVFCLGLLLSSPAAAAGRLSVVDFGDASAPVDRSGNTDTSNAIGKAIDLANRQTDSGIPSCVYFPAGIYRVKRELPRFQGPGCVVGDGSSQSTIILDRQFTGDLFSWSEAWRPTKPGATVAGLRIQGDSTAQKKQSVFVFYDRNDEISIDDVSVYDVPGRVLYAGLVRYASQAYIRESRFHDLRFFNDGAPGEPVIEITSQGSGVMDASNELKFSQIDIYGSRGPSLVIRNQSQGLIRNISFDGLRVEGAEGLNAKANLVDIGDDVSSGVVSSVTLQNVELIDPYANFAAIRITAAPNSPVPYQITVSGMIGGGITRGIGLQVEAARNSTFTFVSIHSNLPNLRFGSRTHNILVDGLGQERCWTWQFDDPGKNSVYVHTFVDYPTTGNASKVGQTYSCDRH